MQGTAVTVLHEDIAAEAKSCVYKCGSHAAFLGRHWIDKRDIVNSPLILSPPHKNKAETTLLKLKFAKCNIDHKNIVTFDGYDSWWFVTWNASLTVDTLRFLDPFNGVFRQLPSPTNSNNQREFVPDDILGNTVGRGNHPRIEDEWDNILMTNRGMPLISYLFA